MLITDKPALQTPARLFLGHGFDKTRLQFRTIRFIAKGHDPSGIRSYFLNGIHILDHGYRGKYIIRQGQWETIHRLMNRGGGPAPGADGPNGTGKVA